jgi:2-polyprenyl-3-methyl-5-hydroxy-6-metoxy-1,4-benzoquinol methylase
MDLERIYARRFQGVARAKRAAVWSEISQYLFFRFGSPARVLDPAAGFGEFIASIPAAERWAVDQVDHGLSTLEGVHVRIAPITQVDLPAAYFDLIFVSNFLEHLSAPERVADFLTRSLTWLRPGGRIAVLGPNFRYCSREYFDCADHVLPLTHVSVAEHLCGAGYTVEDVVPRFLPYSSRSFLPKSAWLTRAFLRTPPAWWVLGKQFLVTGIRPGIGADALAASPVR